MRKFQNIAANVVGASDVNDVFAAKFNFKIFLKQKDLSFILNNDLNNFEFMKFQFHTFDYEYL